MIVTITAPTALPVSRDQLKSQLYISEDDWNNRLDDALAAALEFAEKHCSLKAGSQTLQLRLDAWPDNGEIEIPVAPVREIVEVSYVDVDGIEQIIDADQYSSERQPDGALITFVSGFSPPLLKCDRHGVLRVTFAAGFDDPAQSGSGDDPDLKLPPTLKYAVLMLAAHYFENPSAVADKQTYPVVMAAQTMLDQLRNYR